MRTSVYQIIHPNGVTELKSLEAILSESPRTLLYFYPADNTPGCTLEAQSFTVLREDFRSMGIQVIGVSVDNEASHKKFHESCNLGIDLISDTHKTLHDQFEVIGEKKNYGKVYIGVIRSTFLLNPKGGIIKAWRNVKVNGHAEKVLREAKEI
ncbi:MAG: peroxiredoxin [Candidatus Gracilibacteria bacterium]|nr:peroxiredoxin [Candidatus Gracilibacteria bacterium]